jgi:hypothetical protein
VISAAPVVGAVAISGHAALTAFGRGVDRMLPAAWAGEPGFGPVGRFDVAGRRVRVAAVFAGLAGTATDLHTELVTAITTAAAQAVADQYPDAARAVLVGSRSGAAS